MAFLTWTDSLSTGNNEVDAQHQKLVAILNQLYDAMRAGQGQRELSVLFDELLAYTDYHFKTEERLFLATDYADKDTHLKQHADLVKQATDLQARFRAGEAFITAEVLTFLKGWVTHHISETDVKLKGVI